MENKKVELLAPAGNYESFLGAIHAGADAVYLGGEKYGARAYADNFTSDEICQAISYAHVFKKKVYLTVNTLMKNEELSGLIPYLDPFYDAGLDGVIVQDIGAFLTIRDAFPGLELHVSTQMTVTGAYSARLLKELGAVRIVPARELSLTEIAAIKEETGLELETFIHGAMCYCYSGQCLFSSILGGRSGNRGRCAQPCRLPYQIGKDGKEGKEQYPLSLKDMCTISFLPKLIEAGIDSFKIEGRMKKPEYAAGVTAIYRKYIDSYYEKGSAGYRVEKKDLQELESLYIRSQIQDGYYFKHNGADMVTLSSPAYSGSDEVLLRMIRNKYIDTPMKKPISMYAVFKTGEKALLKLTCDDLTVSVNGEEVQPAVKQPVTEENIIKGLCKMGNTPFTTEPTDIRVETEGDIFYPLKAINELRRMGVEALLQAMNPYDRKRDEGHDTEKAVHEQTQMLSFMQADERTYGQINGQQNAEHAANCRILVSTREQLSAVMQGDMPVDILYLEAELFGLSYDEFLAIEEDIKRALADVKLYIALPFIFRRRNEEALKQLLPVLEEADGCLVRNLDEYEWLQEQGYQGEITTDYTIYGWNDRSLGFLSTKADCVSLPLELNKKELRNLLKKSKGQTEQLVYGYIPLMVTANCIGRTSGGCLHDTSKPTIYYLKDRYKKKFPVSLHCRYCYNLIYNTVPLSLHDKVLKEKQENAMRLSFTVESKSETMSIIKFFTDVMHGREGKPPYAEYTLGHEKRGVE